MARKIFKKVTLLFVSVFIISGITITSHSLRASAAYTGNAGNQGGGTGAVGNWESVGTHFNSGYGVHWKVYPADSDVMVATGDGKYYNTFTVRTNCKTLGATVYYRLGVAEYYRHADGSKTPTGNIYGLIPTSNTVRFGGLYNIAPGGESWSTVQAHFNIAYQHNATAGHTWNDVSWFCYNPDWGTPCSEEDKQDPNNPVCYEPENETEAAGYFWSKSKIEAVAGGDIPAGIQVETEEDGTEEIKYSTDQENPKVKFTHTLGYSGTYRGEGEDVPGTGWNVHEEGDGLTGHNLYDEGQDFAANTEGAGGGVIVSPEENKTNELTVHLNVGETKRVCQTINYSPKYVNYEVIEHAAVTDTDPNRVTPDNPTGSYEASAAWTEYKLQTSGLGSSTVCATITRPGYPDINQGIQAGSVNSDIMFAGEQSTAKWEIDTSRVPNFETRPIQEARQIVFTVPVTTNYYGGITGGNQRQSQDPCAYHHGKTNSDFCINAGSSENEQKTILVPDNVGWKYCNSFGYYYEYRWYSSKSGWSSYSPYWSVYNSSCRTIAKKPSVAIWNGSLKTAGNSSIKTSLSRRHAAASISDLYHGILANDNRMLYGSWSEFLDVIGGSVTGHTSGSALALGSKRQGTSSESICNTNLGYSNTTLTISNVNCNQLGNSGISTNSTYITRLKTYFKDAPRSAKKVEIENNGYLSSASLDPSSGTTIIVAKGNLTIDRNIITNPGRDLANIYEIPQVIIYADNGDVNITSNVTRLDAWIIADGHTLNTCNNFTAHTTQSDAPRQLYNDCTNQLVFNGPVYAARLKLNRSFGSDPLISRRGTFNDQSQKETPAEIFNLRADTYLWAYAQAGRYDSSYTESYSRELPPRY